MRQSKPAKEMHVGRPPGDRHMLEGDILVTAVGEHYAIGRLNADRDTQEHLGWQLDRTEALKQACALAGANHRVFLHARAGTSDYLPFDCAEVSKEANSTGSSSQIVGDDAFNQFQQTLLADFATTFDAWVLRATVHNGRSLVVGTTLGDVITRGPACVDQDAIREFVQVVYDLARLCRHFVFGDVWAWAFFLRRQGLHSTKVMKMVAARAADTKAAAYERKWRVGLRQIKTACFETADEAAAWTHDAWTVAVEETTHEFVSECLRPALIDPQIEAELKEKERRLKESSAHLETLSRQIIEQFRLIVFQATGRKVTMEDLAVTAGYKDTSELKRFQRNDKRLGGAGDEAIERTLRLEPIAFIELLDKRRQALAR